MKTLVIIPAYNEAEKVAYAVVEARYMGYDVLLVDDGSTDGTYYTSESLRGWRPVDSVLCLSEYGVIHHEFDLGVGAAIRTGITYAIANDYDFVVIMNATGKTPARFIPKMVQTLESADLVQGSRYLGHGINTPRHRRIGQWLHAKLFWLVTGRRLTDTTSGFRAMRVSTLKDLLPELNQPWLNGYELEPYLLRRAVELGYRVTEVPVDIVYPKTGRYTKMKPLIDWWHITKPLLVHRNYHGW